MIKQRIFLVFTLLIITLSQSKLIAQTPTTVTQQKTAVAPAKTYKKYYRRVDTVKNTDFSLKGQYEFMLSRSKSINGYKLINPSRLSEVWKSVSDTLKKERAELKNAKSKIAQQNSSISGLKTDINEKETSLDNTEQKIDQISFLGINFNKGTYNAIVWTLIIGLAIALVIVIARSAKNIIEAKHRTQLYDEVNTEYLAFKAKANEKERKLARELQDERNAMEELKGRGK